MVKGSPGFWSHKEEAESSTEHMGPFSSDHDFHSNHYHSDNSCPHYSGANLQRTFQFICPVHPPSFFSHGRGKLGFKVNLCDKGIPQVTKLFSSADGNPTLVECQTDTVIHGPVQAAMGWGLDKPKISQAEIKKGLIKGLPRDSPPLPIV